jgi:hypothetical protein
MRAEVDQLQAERHSTNEALSDAAEALREKTQQVSDVDRLRDFQRRVTEEVEEFEDAANDDPATPPVALHMIKLLRMAMAETTEAGDLR